MLKTYAYPKFSLKAVAAMISFRRDLQRDDTVRSTMLQRVLLVLNEHDIAIRNDVARRVTNELFDDIAERIEIALLDDSLGLTHDVLEPNGDNRDKMDAVRRNLWPLLGIEPPPPGTPSMPIPGGGYFPELIQEGD